MKKRTLKQLVFKKATISNLKTVNGGMLKSSVSNCYCHSDLCETKITCPDDKITNQQDQKI
ncbi:hypothetical protein [Kordia zhangzhouensis]|uniref:hypothetical protein n=1 Tax=Kordia zhangzhouensis TaxID=1620405 RepID=UPI0012FBA453|nr:hypothetical protein [Kordia zhangzhouensis]